MRRLLRALAVVAVVGGAPSCQDMPNNACSSMKWARGHNMTCCLGDAPWLSGDEQMHCMGFGLGCPALWSEWEAHDVHPDKDECYCDTEAGECTYGTIADMLVECGC